MTSVKIAGITVNAKQKVRAEIPVTTLANGLELTLPVFICNGARPGPKLLLTALSHGDGIVGFEVIRKVLESLNLDELAGTVVAVPCQNPVGFEWGTRNTPTDSYNMNRSYPGNPNGWFTEQLTAAISPLCKETDLLIDWHGGGEGLAIHYVLAERVSGGLGEEIRKMAFAYSLEYVYDGAPAGPAAAYSGTLDGYMLSLGKPCIIAEVGSSLELAFDQIAQSVRGVFNVMKLYKMIEGDIELPHTQWLIKERPLLRPKHGGMFYPLLGPEMLNKSVPQGTVIAEVRNVRTLEVIEEIAAPCEETVFLMMRGRMTKVHPGDYAYIVGNLRNAEQITNS